MEMSHGADQAVTRCIYCRRSEGPFTTEHVIPEAFGLYGPETLVLNDAVCLVSSSGSLRRHPSKWVWADDFPAVTLAELLALRVIHRTGTIQEFLDVAAGGGRRVEKHDSAGLAAGVLPRVRHDAPQQRAGAGSADGNLIADPKGDLAGEDPGDLVTVTMLMEQTLRTGGAGFLRQPSPLLRLVAPGLAARLPARRPPIRVPPPLPARLRRL